MGSDPVGILERLVGFATVSRTPNVELIDYVQGLLEGCGARVERFAGAGGQQANLFAGVGPPDRPGVVLSGHSDVVPVTGQAWTVPPFRLTERAGRFYGRGSADMKGFLACALAAMERAARLALRHPLYVMISFDEEVGCVGVRGMLARLDGRVAPASVCIVGEPTGMAVAVGHKGKRALEVRCTGREVHSSLAPQGLNAIHLASDFVQRVRAIQDDLAERGARDEAYEIPYTTLHAGTIEGGVVLNIVPGHCTLEMEIRHLADQDPEALVARLRESAEAIVAPLRGRVPEAAIEIAETSAYPALDQPPGAPAVRFVGDLIGANAVSKMPFGTEAGLISRDLGLGAVVCGPGTMEQGHKADEYVSGEQLRRCEAMLDALIGRLVSGAGTPWAKPS